MKIARNLDLNFFDMQDVSSYSSVTLPDSMAFRKGQIV